MRFSLKLIACIILAVAVVSSGVFTLSFPPGDKELRNPKPTPSHTPSVVFSYSPFPSLSPFATSTSPNATSVVSPNPFSLPSTSEPSPTQTPTPQPSPSQIPSPTLTSTPSPQLSQLFNVDLAYAFVGPLNYNSTHSHFGMEMHPVNAYPVYILLNLTYLGNPKNEPYDAKLECYLVELKTDTGTTASYIEYYGTNLNPSYSDLPMIPPSSPSEPSQTIGFGFNLNVNESFLAIRITDSASFISGESGLGLWINGIPNTINMSIRRIGWLTVQGGSISTVSNPASNAILLQVQLQKFRDGFLFNKLVPLDQLAQMDPFNPPT